jgi:hypothetical protein
MTTSPCQLISETLGELFICSEVKGFTRSRTPYLYPDGDVIDLFYKISQGRGIITDLGETIRWLLSQTVTDYLSKKQEQAIQDILLTHDVEQYRGSFIVRLRDNESLNDALMRLAQVSIAVSNLYFLFRVRLTSSIQDEVAEALKERNIKFVQNEKLLGRHGRTWRVNFHTWHFDHSSLVQILSTGNKATASTKANNILAGWHDLFHLKTGSQPFRFISLFDDSFDVWNAEIISQLEEFSDVAYWSDPDQFFDMLVSE